MNDENPKTDALGDAPAREVLSFNLPRPRCPICGNTAWERALPNDLKPGEPFDEVIAAVRAGKLQHLPVRTSLCSNCGFVRQHVAGKPMSDI
jgi:rubredoxin